MARSQVKLNSFSNVTAGNTATLQLPLGRTYDQIGIQFSGITLAQMKNISVEVNGKAIQTFKDGKELADLNKFYGRNTTATILDFHFKQPEMKTLAEQRMFGLGTASLNHPAQSQLEADQSPAIQVVTLVMDIDAAAANPKLSAFAIQSDPSSLGSIVKVKRFPIAVNAGLNEYDKIPRPASARIKAIHVISEATIESVVTKVDNVDIAELDRVIVEKIQVGNGRAPQANIATTDFCLEGDMKQAVPLKGIQDLRLHITTADDTASQTFATLVVEYFDTLSGI